MWFRILPVIVIAVAASLYHLGSKTVGEKGIGDPWVALAFVYGFSLLLSIVGGVASNASFDLGYATFRSAAPFMGLVALGCVGIEAGYLFAYKAGWQVSELFPLTSVASGVAVLATGLLFFGETLSLVRVLGLGLVVGGMVLVHWK